MSHLICGGVYDWSTGLIYKNGQYFDPNLGIWLALTPLMLIQAWKKRKRGRYQWILLLCVGLLALGVLAGCGKDVPDDVHLTDGKGTVVLFRGHNTSFCA